MDSHGKHASIQSSIVNSHFSEQHTETFSPLLSSSLTRSTRSSYLKCVDGG